MKKYEYNIVTAEYRQFEDLHIFLNDLGEQGWKICSGGITINQEKELSYELKNVIFVRKVKVGLYSSTSRRS